MDIGENISNSLQYPLKKWTKMLILGIILMIPIVDFIGLGYYLRIIKATFAGIDEIPDFDDLGDLFIDGIKVIIVGFVYAIPAAIFYILAFLSLYYFVSYTIFSVLVIISIIMAVLTSLIAVMAVANMALYDSELGAAFRFSEIMDRIKAITWGKYLIWWIVFIIVNAVVGIIIGIVGFILLFILIGILVFIIGGGYLTMFQARSVALIASKDLVTPETTE
jgi:hypothetical protein